MFHQNDSASHENYDEQKSNTIDEDYSAQTRQNECDMCIDIQLIDTFCNTHLDFETRTKSGNIFLQYYSNSINDPQILHAIFNEYIFETLIDTNEQIASLSEEVCRKKIKQQYF